ncbi:MAG: thermonuclease family protein [Nanoarchaeota archaeon]|nr:thermonuclease family protein [Nanoarchaeota archaeon]
MAWYGDSRRHSEAARKVARKRVTKRYVRTVTNVPDGDTFGINRSIQGSRRIRLANVNMPERNEPGGTAARNKLRRLVKEKKVSITPVGRSYDRLVAKVTQNRHNINKRMKRRK